MSRNRYVSDYRIVESIDSRGRIRSDYEYIGAPWIYAEGEETVRPAKRTVAASCLVGWLAWLGAMLPRSEATRHLYTSMPFIFLAIPLALNAALGWRILRQGEPFEHRHADQVNNRGPACSFFTVFLCAAALLGEVAGVLGGGALLPGDAVFCAGAVLLLACGVICHRQWKRLRCREAGQ